MKKGIGIILALVMMIVIAVAGLSMVSRAKTTADGVADVADDGVSAFSDKLEEFSK